MRKRVFSIAYTNEDDLESFLTNERTLHVAIAPRWSHFWKTAQNQKIDSVILLDRVRQVGNIHYRSQREYSRVAERLSRYNFHVTNPMEKDQQSTTDGGSSLCESGFEPLEVDVRKQRRLNEKEKDGETPTVQTLQYTIENLEAELSARKDQLVQLHMQLLQKQEKFNQELVSMAEARDCKVETQKRIGVFFWHYLLPDHLYILQQLPKLEKSSLFARLELIDSISQKPEAKRYITPVNDYQNEHSVLREDFGYTINYDDLHHEAYLINGITKGRALSMSYVNVHNFIQMHISCMKNGYTVTEDTHTVSVWKGKDGVEIQASVEDTVYSEDLCDMVSRHINSHELQEDQIKFCQITTRSQYEQRMQTLKENKLIHWHIIPVTCNNHFWIVALHIDVKTKQIKRLVLDSLPTDTPTKKKILQDMEQSLKKNHYELSECKNVFHRDPTYEFQRDSFNSALFVSRNIGGLLDLKEAWKDLHSGQIVELDVEEVSPHTRLVKHAELIYMCMAHEASLKNKESL